MNKKRRAVIEKEISKVVSKAILEEIKNPKLNKVILSITDTKVTEDLKFVDISFSVMPIAGEKYNRDEVLSGLNEVRGFLRKIISEEVSLRYIPEVRVKLDDSIEHAIKITKLLDSLKG